MQPEQINSGGPGGTNTSEGSESIYDNAAEGRENETGAEQDYLDNEEQNANGNDGEREPGEDSEDDEMEDDEEDDLEDDQLEEGDDEEEVDGNRASQSGDLNQAGNRNGNSL